MRYFREIRNLVLWILGFFICKLYDFFLFSRDIYNIYIRKLSHKEKCVTIGNLPRPECKSRMAVVAINPSEESIFTTRNLLVALRDNDFNIIVMSNKESDRLRDQLIDLCHLYVERFPIGRDFGSFKHALARSEGEVLNAEIAVLANDSLWYPASFTDTLRSMLMTSDGAWLSLFENHEKHYHSQSFFQVFRRDALSSKAFQSFWRNYIPYSNRVHSIDAGEVGLSLALRKSGFFPEVSYDAFKVLNKLMEIVPSNDGRLVQILTVTYGEGYTRRLGLPSIARHQDKALIASFYAQIGEMVANNLDNTNPTHSLGLLINFLFNAPLKRDLAYRGKHQIGELLYLSTGYTEEEKDKMGRDMRKKGLPSSLRGFKRILYNFGRA